MSSDSESSDSEFMFKIKRSVLLSKYRKKRAKPRFWMSQHIRERQLKGEFTLFKDLDDERFQNYYRVTREQFQELLSLIEADIVKQNTNYRKAVTPEEKLAVCLRFLATGDSFRTIAYSYRMSVTTVSRIVYDTCIAIWNKLQPIHMKAPSKQDWENIAEDFNNIWHFKNCLGAIDGKHVAIKCPPHTGSKFFNYKKYYSIVLLAVVDAHKRFIIIDVGSMGRFSDGGILNDSVFGKKLSNNQLDLPDERPLDEHGSRVPFVFIGDKAFALRKNLLRPYSSTTYDRPKRIFNYRLSRARNVVENAFGILSSRWRVYRRPLECRLEMADHIIKATCVLHNYLSVQSSSYSQATTEDNQNDNNQTTNITFDRLRATREAFNVRNTFCDYFNNAGRISFQDSLVD